jgi:hypothetical protein
MQIIDTDFENGEKNHLSTSLSFLNSHFFTTSALFTLFAEQAVPKEGGLWYLHGPSL